MTSNSVMNKSSVKNYKTLLLVLFSSYLLINPLFTHAAPTLRGMDMLTTASSKDIEDLAPYKVNIVRLMLICPSVDTLSEQEYLEWLNEEIQRIDTLLPFFAAHQIKVIINLHTPPGGFFSYGSRPQFRIFAEQWAQKTFKQVWKTLALHYKKNSTVHALQILSEPAVGSKLGTGLQNWNSLNQEVISGIRKIEKKKVIITSPDYANPRYLSRLRLIRQKGSILYALHYYSPMSFTHQGLAPYPAGVKYPTLRLNKKRLKQGLQKALTYSHQKNLKIIVSEFSVSKFTDDISAAKYLSDLVSIFEKARWGWIYHAWREADTWSIEHSSNPLEKDKLSYETTRSLALRKYFKKNKRI